MEKEKRILILPSWYPPDGGYFFREHSEAIGNAGWEADVLVNRLVGVRKLLEAGRSVRSRYGVGQENGLRVIRSTYWKLPGNERFNIEGWARQALRVYKRYEKQFGRPALILAHSVTWAGYAAYLIWKEFGVPYVIAEHRSFFVWTSPAARKLVKPFHIPFFEKAYLNCARLVLVSASLGKGIEALVPRAMEGSEVIPNMIRGDLFLPPPGPRKTEPFVFLWAGRLEHVKGLDILLEAVNLLRERTDMDFLVRLAGKGTRRERLEQQVAHLGVGEMVRFLGRLSREEMQNEMQGANCFVLPSRYEAFGVVLIEAMASGLPVIATRSGGPGSIVDPENGLLVDREDPEGLAAAMQHLMTNISTYSSEEIRGQTLQRYGEKAVMEQYGRLFQRVLNE